MADPRDHWCACGRWASFGYRPNNKHPMVWGCAMVGGKVACRDAKPEPAELTPADALTSEAAARKDAGSPAPDTDLFSTMSAEGMTPGSATPA